MNNDRAVYDILFNMSWRMRRIHGNLRFSRDTIRNETFELDVWNHQFQTDFVPMCRALERYRATGNANQMVVGVYEEYLFYWHHVIDAFARETPAWRIANIDLLQERIDYVPWVDEIIREEMRVIHERIEREIARNRRN